MLAENGVSAPISMARFSLSTAVYWREIYRRLWKLNFQQQKYLSSLAIAEVWRSVNSQSVMAMIHTLDLLRQWKTTIAR